MKLVFVLLVFGNTLVLLSAAAEERISFLKKLRLLQGRPLGLDYCLCPSIYMPVCASDQKTYSNACKARCKTKVSSQYTLQGVQASFEKDTERSELCLYLYLINSQQFWAIFSDFSAILSNSQQFSAFLSNFYQFSAFFSNAQQLSAILSNSQNSQQFSAITSNSRQFSKFSAILSYVQ